MRFAGRGPNSSSLFLPQAAVVAVALGEGGLGREGEVSGFAKGPLTEGAVTEGDWRSSPSAITVVELSGKVTGFKRYSDQKRTLPMWQTG